MKCRGGTNVILPEVVQFIRVYAYGPAPVLVPGYYRGYNCIKYRGYQGSICTRVPVPGYPGTATSARKLSSILKISKLVDQVCILKYLGTRGTWFVCLSFYNGIGTRVGTRVPTHTAAAEGFLQIAVVTGTNATNTL